MTQNNTKSKVCVNQSFKGQILTSRKKKKVVDMAKRKQFTFRLPNLNQFTHYQLDTFPEFDNVGVYGLVKDNFLFYIGKTVDLQGRLKIHKKRFKFDSYIFYPLKDQEWRSFTEVMLIRFYKPLYNENITSFNTF